MYEIKSCEELLVLLTKIIHRDAELATLNITHNAICFEDFIIRIELFQRNYPYYIGGNTMSSQLDIYRIEVSSQSKWAVTTVFYSDQVDRDAWIDFLRQFTQHSVKHTENVVERAIEYIQEGEPSGID